MQADGAESGTTGNLQGPLSVLSALPRRYSMKVVAFGWRQYTGVTALCRTNFEQIKANSATRGFSRHFWAISRSKSKTRSLRLTASPFLASLLGLSTCSPPLQGRLRPAVPAAVNR